MLPLCYPLNGPMVKRIRRSPLTAESGVRFPLGSPQASPVFLFVNNFVINKSNG